MNTANTPKELDFDQLKDLAVSDPKAFEAYRTQQVEAAISNAPSHMQRRLRGIQFQVDSQRQLHSNPMGSCVKVYQMMQNSLSELNQILKDQGQVALELSSTTPQNNANVISFPG